MLAHCSPRTLASDSVAITKVALSLQGLVLQNLEQKYLQGCVMSGNVLVLCKGSTTIPDMGDTFRGLIT